SSPALRSEDSASRLTPRWVTIPQLAPRTVVLFALEREAKPFLRLFPDRRRIEAGRWLCDDGRIHVKLLGIGKANARRKLEELLRNIVKPQRIIVAGFAGALRADLHVGDVFGVSEIVDEHGGRWQ